MKHRYIFAVACLAISHIGYDAIFLTVTRDTWMVVYYQSFAIFTFWVVNKYVWDKE